jgi:hypothetical protein
MARLFGLVGFTLCLATGELAAQSRFAPIPREPVPQVPCYCRTGERQFDMGETTCLRVNGRGELARCEMVLNNPSWTLLQRPCNPELTQ